MLFSYYSLKGYKHVHRELLVYCQALFGVDISILLLHLPPKTINYNTKCLQIIKKGYNLDTYSYINFWAISSYLKYFNNNNQQFFSTNITFFCKSSADRFGSYGIGLPIWVLSLTGNPPYIGTIGNLVHKYIRNQNRRPIPIQRKASRIFWVNTGIIGWSKIT